MKPILNLVKLVCIIPCILVMISCATKSDMINRHKEALKVRITAEDNGISGIPIRNGKQISVKVNDVDGVCLRRTWMEEACSESELRAMLRQCRKKILYDNSGKKLLLREALTDCMKTANLPDGDVVPLPDATSYIVSLSTLADSSPVHNGYRISSSGGPSIGGKRLVNRPGTNSLLIQKDVQQCVDQSLSDGLVDSYSSQGLTDSSGFYMSHNYQSIAGFLQRFDGCLRSLGYTVQNVESP